LLFRHSVSSLRRLGCGGPGPAPPDPAEGIMYALRGREKRKILSVGAPHEGETTGWGYGPRRGLRPPFRNLPQDGVRAAPRRGAGLGGSGASAGSARATDSGGRRRGGPSRPPPTERSRWALLNGLSRPLGAEKGPAARRRPRAAREAYSLYVERAAEGANEADGPFSAACAISARRPRTGRTTGPAGPSRCPSRPSWPPPGAGACTATRRGPRRPASAASS